MHYTGEAENLKKRVGNYFYQSKLYRMKQLERFLNVGQILTREELRNIKGGRTAIYCTILYTDWQGTQFLEGGNCAGDTLPECNSYASNTCATEADLAGGSCERIACQGVA